MVGSDRVVLRLAAPVARPPRGCSATTAVQPPATDQGRGESGQRSRSTEFHRSRLRPQQTKIYRDPAATGGKIRATSLRRRWSVVSKVPFLGHGHQLLASPGGVKSTYDLRVQLVAEMPVDA